MITSHPFTKFSCFKLNISKCEVTGIDFRKGVNATIYVIGFSKPKTL